MTRRLAALVAALALVLTITTPALARAPGVTRDEGWDNTQAMFAVCVGTIRGKLDIPALEPTPKSVYLYCLAWLNGQIVSPPEK